MPSLPSLSSAALVVCVHLPILRNTLGAVPQHAHELLRLDAVLLSSCVRRRSSRQSLPVRPLCSLIEHTERPYGSQIVGVSGLL